MPIEPTDEEMFLDYEEVRMSGDYNMSDSRARIETGLTEDQYLYVMENYTRLANLYKRQLTSDKQYAIITT